MSFFMVLYFMGGEEMKDNFKEQISKLIEYQKKHRFNNIEIAQKLNVSTRSLNRWKNGLYIPLPIYRDKILNLLKK